MKVNKSFKPSLLPWVKENEIGIVIDHTVYYRYLAYDGAADDRPVIAYVCQRFAGLQASWVAYRVTYVSDEIVPEQINHGTIYSTPEEGMAAADEYLSQFYRLANPKLTVMM